jgi:hypothetical protein
LHDRFVGQMLDVLDGKDRLRLLGSADQDGQVRQVSQAVPLR